MLSALHLLTRATTLESAALAFTHCAAHFLCRFATIFSHEQDPQANAERRLRRDLLFCGDLRLDLLSSAVMLISILVTLSVFWYVVQTLPGLFESLGYTLGILLASFILDANFERDPG